MHRHSSPRRVLNKSWLHILQPRRWQSCCCTSVRHSVITQSIRPRSTVAAIDSPAGGRRSKYRRCSVSDKPRSTVADRSPGVSAPETTSAYTMCVLGAALSFERGCAARHDGHRRSTLATTRPRTVILTYLPTIRDLRRRRARLPSRYGSTGGGVSVRPEQSAASNYACPIPDDNLVSVLRRQLLSVRRRRLRAAGGRRRVTVVSHAPSAASN